MHPKWHKITIYSANAISGAYYDGIYSIDVPDVLDMTQQYQICVESFNINRSSANVNNGYIVSCPQIMQGNTYSTLTQSTNQALLNFNGNSYTRYIDFSSIGTPILNTGFMRNQQFNIILSTLDGVPLSAQGASAALAYFGGGTQWCMTLCVFPVPLR